MSISIKSWVKINSDVVTKNGDWVIPKEAYASINSVEELYRHIGYNYMKFFKMDLLCKWAWIGAEILLADSELEEQVKENAALVLMTHHGCIDVDKRYKETMETIPSPALFVYTLPNIMLGEICIRHSIKGEQMTLMSEKFDTEETCFYVNDLMVNRGMDACVFGWVNAYNDKYDIALFLATKEEREGSALSVDNINNIYSSK